MPSTRYRILAYLPYLRKMGYRCDIRHSYPPKYTWNQRMGRRLSDFVQRSSRVMDCAWAAVRSYDAVVVERELFDEPEYAIERLLRRFSSRLVFDIDDGIFLRFPDKFAPLYRLADHVIAGNSLLEQRCREHCSSTVVIPTSVDLARYPSAAASQTNDRPVIGWIGTSGNIPYLKHALPALKEVASRRDFALRIISSDDHELNKLDTAALNVEFTPWSAETAEQEIAKFNIGIMPLSDEEWEQYKCGFKLIQYMAASVPAIASPVGANREIVNHGVDGLLASDTCQWATALNRYLDEPEFARSVAAAARDKVAREYSIEANAERFAAAVFGLDDAG